MSINYLELNRHVDDLNWSPKLTRLCRYGTGIYYYRKRKRSAYD